MGTNFEWLSVVAKQHKTWVGIVKSFGEYTYHEDLVQQMYITLSKYADPKKIIKDGKVSRGYIFFTLKSLYFQYYNKKKKIHKVSIDDDDKFIQFYDKACKDWIHLVDEVTDDWHWYDKKLWNLYSKTDMSIRKLAEETKISWVSIFNSLKTLKLDIKEKVEESYLDFKNKDYDRI